MDHSKIVLVFDDNEIRLFGAAKRFYIVFLESWENQKVDLKISRQNFLEILLPKSFPPVNVYCFVLYFVVFN